MKQFPFAGGTFTDTRISEAGRELLARQLRALDEPQITALFTAARFAEFNPSADVKAWAEAFRSKVQQIVAGGSCE
jgi:hypothetical protein